MPLYFLSGYPVSDCSLVHYGCENKDNVECVMCDFQHVQISVEADVIATWRRLLRSESFSTAQLRLQNYAIVQPSKLFDFVPQTPTG